MQPSLGISAKAMEEHNVIGTNRIFKNKQDANEVVVQNKARLVAQGDMSILHHVFLLLFTMSLSIIMLFGVILMPFLS